MKRSRKVKLISIFICFLVIFSVSSCDVFASGSFSIGVGNSSLNPGETTTLTITTSNCAGVFSISTTDSSVASISQSREFVDGSYNIVISAGNVGSATITVTAEDVSDTEINSVTGSKSVTISVEEPPPPPVEQEPVENNNYNNYYEELDSNTYLSYLDLNVEGMTPNFVKTRTNYSISVGMDINSIEVSADTESMNSYYYVEGNENLVEGDNTIKITVVAEDGSTRTYTIVVTKSSDPEKSNAYLENLVIENVELSPKFQSEVLEYDLGEVEADVKKLNILTFPKNEKATVEIKGNKELKSGKNTITIVVTAEDQTTKKEYKLKVTKKEEEKEVVVETNALASVERTPSKKFSDFMSNLWLAIKANALLVLMYAFILVEFIQIVYLYKKLNKKDEILEKYGIDENGELINTRSGKRRNLENIDIPLDEEQKSLEDELNEKMSEEENAVKYEEENTDNADYNEENVSEENSSQDTNSNNELDNFDNKEE